MSTTPPVQLRNLEKGVHDLFNADIHAKRVASLANAVTGIVVAGSLAIHAIGRGFAVAKGTNRRLPAAAMSLGRARPSRVNTSPRRQLSLFRQGLEWYEQIPMMPEERLQVLMGCRTRCGRDPYLHRRP